MSIIDKRRNFRVSFMTPIPGEARIASVNSKPIKSDRFFPISILDLSASGMKIYTQINLPANKNIVLQTTFPLENKTVVLQGSLVWKEENPRQKIYGIKFTGITEREERQLIYDLNKIQLGKTRLEKEKGGHRESPAAKMLHALPYPALLVTAERKVLAVNKQSEKLGVLIGDRCYRGYWQNEKACSFCMLEKAPMYNGIVSYAVYIKDKKFLIHWLYLERKIFLHYWIRV
jgi:hypothetical protein